MKKLIILLTVALSFVSCSIKEKPEFLRVDNIKVDDSNSKYITLTADAYFLNKNDISGELKTDEIKVFVNNNQMATVTTESFKVPAKKEFSIPLSANVPTDSLLSNKNLSGLLGSLLTQKMTVQYKGQIKYKVFGFSHTYDVDKTEDIKIKF
ncbi:LEA type 2 family protein [Oceanihabitans sediminis]|uniref:LEA type 2 family protein n=1 Tax=Oceanihabitans sediminis TaxID=1812012 RepID=UPI0009301230|nr:LEA type 2 family protein [Oceanihabitans sediminis]MDX1277758.1 LEA type 2 family protein [Oceanihabitans sediminis]MDX1774806.1 LEA type 2 family protein [Oceanihabitans sediminis]